jgi:hypothetical protein
VLGRAFDCVVGGLNGAVQQVQAKSGFHAVWERVEIHGLWNVYKMTVLDANSSATAPGAWEPEPENAATARGADDGGGGGGGGGGGAVVPRLPRRISVSAQDVEQLQKKLKKATRSCLVMVDNLTPYELRRLKCNIDSGLWEKGYEPPSVIRCDPWLSRELAGLVCDCEQ